MLNRIELTLADLSLALCWPPQLGMVSLPRAFRPFQSPGPGSMRLELSIADPPPSERVPIFNASPIWSLHRTKGGLAFHLFDSYPDLRRRLLIPDEGRDACLSFLAPNRDPFVGPALELLTITHLATRGGAILHGCGISIDGRGIVFAGESGAGKSTLSRLWARAQGIEILSDDRVIVRRHNGVWRLYGTPWHGDEAFAAPGGVPLNRIFFLRHGPHNQVHDLSAAKVVAALLKCSFPPLWDAVGTAAALELFHALAVAVPSAELVFTPDLGAIDLVMHGF